MAASGQCATIPTLTRTDVQTVGTTTVQTEVIVTTTLPPTFVTSTLSTDVCTTNTTSPTSTHCEPTFITSVETVPGATNIVTVTSAVENPITSSVTTTLFTTSCTTTPRPDNPNNDPSTTPPPNPYTPTDITTTSTSSTTLPNGEVSVSILTLTTTPPPAPTTQSDNNSNDGGPNIGVIVGGAVGGFVGLIALALISLYFYKKSTAGFDRVFNNPDDYEPQHNHQDKLGPLDDEPIQPQGYQYGLVGSEMGHNGVAGSNASGPAPNGNGLGGFGGGQEAGFQPSGGNEMGYQPGGNDAAYQPDGTHSRNHSLAPLLGAVGGAAAGAAVYAVSTSSKNNGGSRPSTGGSGQPLISPPVSSSQGYGPQPQGYGTQNLSPNTYPPQGQALTSASYYGSSDLSVYSSSLSPNPSVGSSSWGAGSSTAYAGPQPHAGMMGTLIAGAAPPATNRRQSFGPDNRSGSPVSIQEQRVLQVINPDSSYYASSPPRGSSVMSAAGPSSPVAGSSSAAAGQQARQTVDGKGRPIDTRGQFVPLVHLDGGVYEEPLVPTTTGNAATGPLPPAYSS